MKKKITSFEDLDVYRLAESLGDRVWNIVGKWGNFAKGHLPIEWVEIGGPWSKKPFMSRKNESYVRREI